MHLTNVPKADGFLLPAFVTMEKVKEESATFAGAEFVATFAADCRV